MKTASIKEIKQTLEQTPADELLELCIRLSKFKKENKELLTYLLYEQHNEAEYVAHVKNLLSELFETVNTSQLYFAKKTIRKIIRTANKYIKYSDVATTAPDVLIYVCSSIKALKIDLYKNTALLNLYNSQIKKIKKVVATFHEEEQYDYNKLLLQIAI
ncbi:hypothetical protein ACFOWM_01355 [Ferruginibacter yonginensis]|uniref:Uncharacterized protein n=1 Tax=Ferruginibacter yonginensis TaxID=1310416 RepID=A0ABV8QMR2_9BACT